jgi:hypothetical protein
MIERIKLPLLKAIAGGIAVSVGITLLGRLFARYFLDSSVTDIPFEAVRTAVFAAAFTFLLWDRKSAK